MEIVFLGLNDIGYRLYDWLCDRNEVTISALATTTKQLELVRTLKPDLLVSVGFDHLVPGDVLSIPPRGCINMHPSYLPFNRGKSPNVWSIVEGTPAGVTIHYMDEEFDTGDIIAQRQVETDFADSGKDLHRRLETAQYDLFTEVWPDIEAGEIEGTPQSNERGTYHTTRDFLDLCELDPDEEVRVKDFLDRLRALSFPPFDNAEIEVNGKTYYVDVEIRRDSTEETPEGNMLSSY